MIKETGTAEDDRLYPGRSGSLIYSKDWTNTELGASSGWPQPFVDTLRSLFAAPTPTILYWGNTFRCFYNDAYAEATPGLVDDASLGMPADKLWPQEESSSKKIITIVLEEGIPIVTGYDAGLSQPAEEKILSQARIFYRPVTDHAGKVLGVLASFSAASTDASPAHLQPEHSHSSKLSIDGASLYRQQSEEREQKFRLLADSMPQFVWTGDSEGNLDYFNAAMYKYSGLTPQQVADGGWLQMVHPGDREENRSLWAESIRTGKEFNAEHRFMRHDGVARWQLSRAIPQRDPSGKIQRWVGTSTDIEDQRLFVTELEKQVEARTRDLVELNEALRKSEERYHLMVAEVQDYAILYLNKEGIIENWNKGAEKIKGYLAEEIIGKSFSQFYTDADLAANLPFRLLKQATELGRAVQSGWRLRKDSTLFWANVVITALHDKENNVIGFTKVTHDLTEKKEADDKLKKNAAELESKNAELQAMNAELQSFAYVSSHDLQEPLRKIQMFSALILDNEHQHLSDTGKDYFRRVQAAAARMQILIDDLLTYSRTNITERRYERVNLGAIINEVKKDLREDIIQKNAVIKSAVDCDIEVIPFQFRQLLNNLIGNALKFSKPGEPPVVEVHCVSETGTDTGIAALPGEAKYWHITIADNGIGFDAKYRDRIFEVFQRLHGRKEYKGTGIGLAIVKKIVENHNGIISAHGEPGRGASFDIYLPFIEATVSSPIHQG